MKRNEGMAVYQYGGEYTLIRIGSSREQLEDIKGAFKTQLAEAGFGNSKVGITNLSDNCRKRRGHIAYEQDRKLRRKHPEIACYKCN
ncbi:MAG TPA: hypothetical protein VGC65_11240 [Bacteroidia bacterium]|jgi:hypothetical protein